MSKEKNKALDKSSENKSIIEDIVSNAQREENKYSEVFCKPDVDQAQAYKDFDLLQLDNFEEIETPIGKIKIGRLSDGFVAVARPGRDKRKTLEIKLGKQKLDHDANE